MAIDAPVETELRQLREQVDDDSYLTVLATRLGMSAAAAAALSAHPIISQILTTLLATSPRRFERRFVCVMDALAERQKQIEDKIPDPSYYNGEEFHALLTLILEKLHATHQQEKLRTFGEALANSGIGEFTAEDKEPYIRTLRDLTLTDLHTLRKMKELSSRAGPFANGRVRKGDDASFARLASFGLLQEATSLKDFDLHIPVVPTSRQTPENYARGLADAFKRYFKDAASTTYRISGFGHKFLSFISSSEQGSAASGQ
jgi:hypothetical protein